MSHVILGLGNPGDEYAKTRHNTGRIILENFRKENNFSDWSVDKKLKALASHGKIGKEEILLLEPETFMNGSGASVKPLITDEKGAEKLVVIYDDIDLPMESLKISFDRSSGGHRGVESIIKSLKTRKFTRIRVGICPVTPSGKTKKPKGEEKILDFLMGDFKKSELEQLEKLSEKINEIIKMVISEGKDKAMGKFN